MAFSDKLRVPVGGHARLADRDPRDTLNFDDKDETKEATQELARRINDLQDRLYAEGSRSLLVILQGTDTAGKDGTIREVFDATGPLGVRVTSFRQPSELERAHDYLWRVHAACPPRGSIGIFNRSHYEDVLVVKVRDLAPAEMVEQRYEQINAFEKMLVENGTTVLKFMLHVSRDEQRERLQARLDEPHKNWKFQAGDLEDRLHWGAFQDAYEVALSRCSTQHAPWFVIPSDRKWVRSHAVAKIVLQTLEDMDPTYPTPDFDPKAIEVI